MEKWKGIKGYEGIIFDSVIEASNYLNIGYSCLKAQLTGQNKNKYNIKYI